MKVALCAIIKLENHYLKEWVDYHLNLGFDKIFIYDNNDINGEHPETVVEPTDKIQFINIRGKKLAQIPAYDEFYHTYANNFDWVCFIDIDEFLELKNSINVKDFLNNEQFNNFNCIFINWALYDDNNLITVKQNNYSVLSRFTHKSTLPHAIVENKIGKRFVRTGLNIAINSAHGPMLQNIEDEYQTETPIINNEASIKCCDTLGQAVENKVLMVREPNDLLDLAVIKHFKYKTIEEFVKFKMSRGYATAYKNQGKWMNVFEFFYFNRVTMEKLLWLEQAGKIVLGGTDLNYWKQFFGQINE